MEGSSTTPVAISSETARSIVTNAALIEVARSRNVAWMAVVEAFIVFGLIMGYIWRFRFTHRASWLAILAVLILSHAARGETLSTLGFRRDNLAACLRVVLPFLLLAGLSLASFGLVFRTFRGIHAGEAIMGIAAYSIWGLFQQYLLNGYFVNRFNELSGAPPDAVALLAAALFAIAHLPNSFLMLVTLIGGYVAAKVYLRYRNLYVLGLAHGVLGFLLSQSLPDWLTGHFYVGPR